MKQLEFHESLKNVPLMPLHERDALASDIKEHGQLFPIILLNGKIIDGRNRYLACLARNIEPKLISLNPADPKAFIASANYFRKHWSTDERAHFAALMLLSQENVSTGKVEVMSNDTIPTTEVISRALNVSESTVMRKKKEIREKAKPVQASNGEEVILDNAGIAVPATALPYWRRKTEVQEIINQINAIKRKMNDAKSDPMYCEVGVNGVLGSLNDVVGRLRAAIPAHVCPYCKGVKPDGCKACKGRGVVSKYFWDTAVPTEMKPEMPF